MRRGAGAARSPEAGRLTRRSCLPRGLCRRVFADSWAGLFSPKSFLHQRDRTALKDLCRALCSSCQACWNLERDGPTADGIGRREGEECHILHELFPHAHLPYHSYHLFPQYFTIKMFKYKVERFHSKHHLDSTVHIVLHLLSTLVMYPSFQPSHTLLQYLFPSALLVWSGLPCTAWYISCFLLLFACF